MSRFFVEIGSSDFDTLLPLVDNGWGGIFVEPSSESLNCIKKHPHHDNVFFENIALSSYDGEIEYIYYDSSLMEQGESLDWVRGVGSTDLDLNIMNANPQWKEYESVVTVKCLTLDSLLDKYEVNNIDFMKIDVEGAERDVLHNYSWRVKPIFLKIETKHWDSYYNFYKIDVRSEIDIMLRKNNYLTWYEENDLYAIR